MKSSPARLDAGSEGDAGDAHATAAVAAKPAATWNALRERGRGELMMPRTFSRNRAGTTRADNDDASASRGSRHRAGDEPPMDRKGASRDARVPERGRAGAHEGTREFPSLHPASNFA